MQWLEPVTAGDGVLKPLDLFAVELDQRAASCAYQMIVMAVFVVVFVEDSAVVELKFTGKTAFL
jgi:hypothetical protein